MKSKKFGTDIPNPNGPHLKTGDKVKIEEGDWAGYVGEVVEFVKEGQSWIKTVKVIGEDGKVTFVEVKDVVLSAVQILQDFSQTNIFKKAWTWFTNLFRKKGKKKPL